MIIRKSSLYLWVTTTLFLFLVVSSEDSIRIQNPENIIHGEGRLRARDLIYGGNDAESGRYPYFVRLVGTGQCGGALIAPEVVVTAAHCKAFIEHAEIGRHDLTDRNERFDIRSIDNMIVHPEWDGRIPYNDIMLVVLDAPVDTPVIELNRNNNIPFQSGEDLAVLGFGNTIADPLHVELADVLQEIETDYIPFEECSVASDLETGATYGDSKSGKTSVTEDWLCTLANNPRRGNCVGDAGGPVVKKGSASFREDLLVGIVVSGVGCGNIYLPDQNQRISYHVDFIRRKTCQNSADPPGSFQCPGTPTYSPSPFPTEVASDVPSSPPLEASSPKPTSTPVPSMLPTTPRPTPEPILQPSISPVPPTQKPNPAPTRNGLVGVEVRIEFDGHPESTGWLIADADYETFLHHIPYGAYPPETISAAETVYLKPGRKYMFTIEDKFGDGMCCPSPGSYKVLYQGELMVSGGGAFGYFETTYFSIPRN